MKVGMLPVWDRWGGRHPCTVLHLDNCRVVQVKRPETDGYCALQLGVGTQKVAHITVDHAEHNAEHNEGDADIMDHASERRRSKSRQRVKATLLGHFRPCLEANHNHNHNANLKGNIGNEAHKVSDITSLLHTQSETISRKLAEFRVTADALLPVGTQIAALHFVPGQLVDVCGTSKGKGFQGAMKRWNFGGGPASHGNSLAHRALGATGQCQDPGRVFKNKKMPGRMGGQRTTVQNLYLLKIDTERQLLYVKGAVPGCNGSFVRVSDAVKGPFHPQPPPFPTWDSQDSQRQGEEEDVIQAEIFAPLPDADTGILKEPENAY